MNAESKQQLYDAVLRRVTDLVAGETDLIAVMATVVCELHYAFDYYDWIGLQLSTRSIESTLRKFVPELRQFI